MQDTEVRAYHPMTGSDPWERRPAAIQSPTIAPRTGSHTGHIWPRIWVPTVVKELHQKEQQP